MGWQTQSVIQLFAGNTIINPNGAFTYSGTPAAGNLIASQAPASGTDSFGNHYLIGVVSYGSTFATQLGQGFVTLYSGSLAAGWTGGVTISRNTLGDLLLESVAGRQVITLNNTLDDGSGGATFSGTVAVNALTVGGSSQTGGPIGTGFFNTQGLASGSYGSTHQHTLPNFPTATHTHNL